MLGVCFGIIWRFERRLLVVVSCHPLLKLPLLKKKYHCFTPAIKTKTCHIISSYRRHRQTTDRGGEGTLVGRSPKMQTFRAQAVG